MTIPSAMRNAIASRGLEGTSDSVDKLQDLDEDENFFSSDDIPKLQFRKVTSTAHWIHDLGMAEVVERKGNLWTTTGIVRNGKTYCLIEEVLYLAEIGALHLLDSGCIHVALEDIYNKLLDDKYGCFWEAFEVYKYLKSLGYIISRYGKPWTMKSDRGNSPQAVPEFDRLADRESDSNEYLSELFNWMQIKQVKPLYNVYLPNSKFKKSSPDRPIFVLCLVSHPPSKEEIAELERRCNNSPLKVCNVDPSGRVSFFAFNRVELPVLP